MSHSAPPLPYAPPPAARPGLITAVGVLSIVLGAFSALSCVSGVFSAFAYMSMSSRSAPAAATFTVYTSTYTAYSSGASPAATTAPATAPTTAPTAAPAAFAPPPFAFHVDRGASILSIAESALSLVAASMLIAAGIFVLRNSPRGASLHRKYLVVKLPLIAVSAVAAGWMASGMMSFMGAVAGPGAAVFNRFGALIVAAQVIFHLAFSLAYPIALMIILSTRTWKDYWDAARSGALG